MKARRLIIVGAGVLVLSLLLNLPAGVAVGWAGLDEHLAMEGVRGTIWSGGATAASVDDVHIGQLRWRFRPLAMLRGRLDYEVEMSGPTLRLQGSLGPTAGGGVRVTDARGFVQMAALRPLIPSMAPLGLDGTLNMDIERLVLSPLEAVEGVPANPAGVWPSEAAAAVRVMGVRIPLIGNDPIGDYQLDIQDDPEGRDLLVQYRDLAGPLELDGSARVRPDGTFDRQCTARARPGAPSRLVQAAPMICDESLF